MVLNFIFKFFAVIFAFGTLLELIYHFPVFMLDMSLIAITVFLYYLLKVLKLAHSRAFKATLITGVTISLLSALPINFHKATDNTNKFVNEKSIIPTILKGNVYRSIKKGYKVRSLNEFTGLASAYYLNLFLKHFYMVFLVSALFCEITTMRLTLKSWSRWLAEEKHN